MKPTKRALFAWLGAGVAVAGLVGCERIAFYSTGRKNESSSSTSTSTSATTGGGSGVTPAALLDAIATCHIELLTSFRDMSAELKNASAEAKSDPNAKEKVRAAWKATMEIWQRAELFQFGPAGPATTPGGISLRDEIYSWPLTSRCLVEQNIVSKAYEAPGFGETALINMRGLAASEYLTFYEANDNVCSPSTGINAMGTWAALGAAEIAVRKTQYASVVDAAVAKKASDLLEAWRPEAGNFKAKFAGAGGSGSPYATEQAALNAVSDAMFYIEILVKDTKLARPLGLMDCDESSCPEAVESRFAKRSRAHIRNNLVGFRMLLAGCKDGEGVGFDDLLISRDQTTLAEKMKTAVNEAIVAADAVPTDDLGAAIIESPESVLALHAAVKKITDLLKTEFVSVLNLELPQTVEGDND